MTAGDSVQRSQRDSVRRAPVTGLCRRSGEVFGAQRARCVRAPGGPRSPGLSVVSGAARRPGVFEYPFAPQQQALVQAARARGTLPGSIDGSDPQYQYGLEPTNHIQAHNATPSPGTSSGRSSKVRGAVLITACAMRCRSGAPSPRCGQAFGVVVPCGLVRRCEEQSRRRSFEARFPRPSRWSRERSRQSRDCGRAGVRGHRLAT